jgi:hypothetical protein
MGVPGVSHGLVFSFPSPGKCSTYPQHIAAVLLVDVLPSRSKGEEISKDEHEKSLDRSHGVFVLFCFVCLLLLFFGRLVCFEFESCELVSCFCCSIVVQLSSQPRLACKRSNEPDLIRSYHSTVRVCTNVLIHSYPSFNDPVLNVIIPAHPSSNAS